MSQRTLTRLGAVVLVALTAAGCERPPVDDAQNGYRGVGMQHVTNPRLEAVKLAANKAPDPLPAAQPGPAAPDSQWKNVQVLKGLSVAEFNRTMTAFTQWVAPKQGCLYCHAVEGGAINYASDELYTKVVARRMLQMTQHVNANYTNHVQQTGVTCYTCHRGNAVPANIWFYTDRYQALRHYVDRQDFRVQGVAALPAESQNKASILQTQYAYTLMINMSNALGVNCTFCHNSRIWSSWEQSTPQRMTAMRGIRMARDLNSNYLVPLQSVWPAKRLGPHGDGPKLQCATCHNGVSKPLYGAPMAKDYPAMYPVQAPAEQQAIAPTDSAMAGGS